MEHSSCSSPADKQCGDALRFWGFGDRIMMRPMDLAFDETSDMASGFNKPFSMEIDA